MKTELLDKITLAFGDHRSRKDGVCAMEAVAWLAGEKHTDHPACCSFVIASFVRTWNDSLPTDADRDRLLKPLLPIMIGTVTGRADDLKRSYMVMDWLVRTHLPAWLDLTETLAPHATRLRGLPVIDSASALVGASEMLAAVGSAAAQNAAENAACDVDGAAVRAAVEAAALDAAWDASWYAGWDATEDAAKDAPEDAAWNAVRSAAKYAVEDAADAAPEAKVQPTVEMLQQSAVELLKRMCAIGRN